MTVPQSVRVPLVRWLALLLVLPLGIAAAEEPSQEELDARFAAMMEGKRLEGEFSVVNPDGVTGGHPELYMVSELAKGEGNTWIFTASMSYGADTTTELPIPVEVLWAGETPVLTMTDQTIEGLGTFTARVMIFDGRYAGTWQHGPFGGHMWGLLVDAGKKPATGSEP